MWEEGALKTTTRRSFLKGAASAVAAATVTSTTGAVAAPLEVQRSSMSMGRTTVPRGYGMPSKNEGHVTGNRTDVYANKQNYSAGSMTPIQHQHGIVTPNRLIFEWRHAMAGIETYTLNPSIFQ